MSIVGILISLLAIGSVIGGIFLIKRSAKKFDLTQEQLERIKERNEKINRQEKSEE